MSLTVLPDFLSVKQFILLYDEILHAGWQVANKDNPDESKTEYYSPRVSLNVNTSNYLTYLQVASYVKLRLKKYYRDIDYLKRWHVNGQFFGQESNFHTDELGDDNNRSITCVIFMNLEWSSHWGGEFCFYDHVKKEYKHVAYVPNTAVIFPSEYEHCGRSPNINTDQLRTSVAFIFKRNKSLLSVK